MRSIAGGEALVVEVVEIRRDLGEMVENRASTRFGGMSGEHGHHGETREEGAYVVCADPVSRPLVDRRGNRLDDRSLPAIPTSKHTHAVLLLGNVHELQLLRQRVGHVSELGGSERRHAVGKRLSGRATALSTELGGSRSKLVDDGERFRARSLSNRVVE
jgi:hypothetical protein